MTINRKKLEERIKMRKESWIRYSMFGSPKITGVHDVVLFNNTVSIAVFRGGRWYAMGDTWGRFNKDITGLVFAYSPEEVSVDSDVPTFYINGLKATQVSNVQWDVTDQGNSCIGIVLTNKEERPVFKPNPHNHPPIGEQKGYNEDNLYSIVTILKSIEQHKF